jgi:hypothetical protein
MEVDKMAKSEGQTMPVVLTVQANPLAICTELLDGTQRHVVVLDRDAAVSLCGALLVVSEHEHLAATGQLKQTASTSKEPQAPLFTMRPAAGEN